MVCSEKLRRWSSSSIVLRRWVTGTPPVTHTYTRAIKQPTLHYLTRSVRRAAATCKQRLRTRDRKSTRLNSSHVAISYAVFCLKKKKSANQEHNASTRA